MQLTRIRIPTKAAANDWLITSRLVSATPIDGPELLRFLTDARDAFDDCLLPAGKHDFI